MTKSKYELLLDHLIHKEEDKAKELLHQLFIEKAREIHESQMQEEDAVMDIDESEHDDAEVESEEYFEEDDVESAEEELGDEMIADVEVDVNDETDENSEDEDESEEKSEDESDEDEDEDPMAELRKMFDTIKSELDDAEDAVEDLLDKSEELEEDAGVYEGPFGDGSHDAEDFVEPGHGDHDGIYEEDDFFEEIDKMLDEEDFDDLTESALEDLEKVHNKNTEDLAGAKTGETGSFSVNKTSPIPQKPRNARQGGKPVEIKGDNHKGYDRETPPKSVDGTGSKDPKNVKKATFDGTAHVKKKGDENALLNSDEGFGEENKMSPFSKMGTKGVQK